MLNIKQNNGLSMMKKGFNIFVTGNAGTGKSYLLNEYINYLEDNSIQYIVTAPTGIAALNIGGVTAHRAFKIPLNNAIKEIKSLPSIFKEVEVVIIDEISMIRRDVFDYIAKTLIHVNKFKRKAGLKDVQLIVSGDFLQLPPVITDNDRVLLEEYYGEKIYNAYAFESKYWNIFNFKVIALQDIVRQNDKEFIENLNFARVGNTRCIQYFNANAVKEKIDKAITLCSRRKEVDEINQKEYEKIQRKEFTYEALIEGEVKESDKPTDDILKLKVGVRVMTLVNDYMDRFQNGSFGTVFKLTKESIYLLMDNGETVELKQNRWSIKDYKLRSNGKIGETEIGSFTQYPIKLAYAITIHKSQGQTYDCVNLSPYCWDCGQLYVALSRVKSIDGLHLNSDIQFYYIRASYKVLSFYREIGVI